METLISLAILVVIVVIAFWVIKQIPFPAGLEVLRTILLIIIGVFALIKLLAFL